MLQKRGKFICFEGLDRSGKTTQSKLLQQYFIETKEASTLIAFPDRSTKIGQIIDQYLKQ
jgi:dTMP kinase